MNISHSQFYGIAPAKNPRYLPEGWAQVAVNADVTGTSLKGLPALQLVANNFFSSDVKSIYRFGQTDSATLTEREYWFSWNKDVDVCRSQLAKDANEWTFFTGDGPPRATNKNLALPSGRSSLPPYIPHSSRLLGLPAPSSPCVATAGDYDQEKEAAELYLSASSITSLASGRTIKVRLDGGSPVTVAIENSQVSTVQAALNAVSGITASFADDGLLITSASTGTNASIILEAGTGGQVTVGGSVKTTGGIKKGSITFKMAPQSWLIAAYVVVQGAKMHTHNDSAASMASNLNSWRSLGYKPSPTGDLPMYPALAGKFKAKANADNTITIEALPAFSGTSFTVKVSYHDQSFYQHVYDATHIGRDTEEAPVNTTTITLSAVHLSEMSLTEGISISNGKKAYPGDRSPTSVAAALVSAGVSAVVSGDSVVVTLSGTAGGSATYYEDAGDYAVSASGKTLEPGLKETRVYTYTYVEKIDNFEFESPPAGPSNEIDLYHNQDARISGFMMPPVGYTPTHIRIYRSISGTYLFVDEINISEIVYTDKKSPDFLSEEIPSLTWAPPPPSLRGLINLPNGIMAGFSGRDICFCEPYRPHAWPEGYMQAVSWQIVGLGSVDTTLVVLTTGYPYFVQGSHPDSMVVVKSAADQACVSKDSIVSTGAGVIYATPDGLYITSPSDTRNLLDEYLTRDNWQAWNPETLKGFLHDNKYYGFTSTCGFVYHLERNQLAMLDFGFNLFSGMYGYQQPVTAFSDLESDTLYVVMGRGLYKVYDSSTPLPYRWRSKKITLPQKVGFSAMQVEAETYNPTTPITVSVYADGELLYEKIVDNKQPFRLPPRQCRVWEFELTGQTEIFNVAIGQSFAELAGV